MKDIEKTTIIGVISNRLMSGVQALSIDSKTGEIIDSHFCSSENFAKSDLGFSDPLFLEWSPFENSEHSTVGFNKRRLEYYQNKYPYGFELEWIGYFKKYDKIEELFNLNQELKTILEV